MEQSSRPGSGPGPEPGDDGTASVQRQRRNRGPVSCGPCRASKLRCDRAQPCDLCIRRGRVDLCVYAPRPASRRSRPPPRAMSSRLQRLEGMVRSIIGAADHETGPPAPPTDAPPSLTGRVIDGTTFVGATHCMAMLEDIEHLKSYFVDSQDDAHDLDSPSDDDLDAPEMLMWSRTGPASRDELLAQLPERHVADRLITRYFASMSPSQHVLHRPSFAAAYARFWQDSSSASLHWIAQLFMVLAVGILFNRFSAPHEVDADSLGPAQARIRRYRCCAGWALIMGKYMQPTMTTLPAFLLYVEAHFLLNRGSQMNCYVLSGVCLRLMLKMGLHRDPDKLTGISAFEGEMRRRMWNMAIQIETLVAFHMGLPSMLQGIETDTAVPRNLQDDDFDEHSPALPPARPWTEHTHMVYPIHKTSILRVFGQIARQAHALSPPSYADVMELDRLLHETWAALPAYLRVRPLDECVGDAPILIMQRFGLAALFNKCRCVLHRRYLAEPVVEHSHDYSRRQCLEGAVELLDNQHVIWQGCRPGNVLSHNGWLVSSLAVHDYLLAAVIVYLVMQGMDREGAADCVKVEGASLTRQDLGDMIRRSHVVWCDAAKDSDDLRKTADTLGSILAKLASPADAGASHAGATSTVDLGPEAPTNWPSVPSFSSNTASSIESASLSGLTLGQGIDSSWQSVNNGAESGLTPSSAGRPEWFDMDLTGDGMLATLDYDASWTLADNMDWRYLDISLAHSHTAGTTAGSGPTWVERLPLDDVEAMGSAAWQRCASGNGGQDQQGWPR